MKMRIAHVTATFPPYQGGTGNVCYHNARELVHRGHEVHVFTAAIAHTTEHEVLDGIHVHRLRPLMRFGNAPVLPGLLRALHGFDIIHLHYPFFGGELSALAASLSRVPLLITYHQDVLLSGFIALIERVLRQSAGRLTLRSAARVLFTSMDYGQASYIRPMLSGREQHIDALANGVDIEYFLPGPASAELRMAYGLHTHQRIALLVAGLDTAHYFKGVHVFLDALTQLPDDVCAIIVGDGDLRAAYVARAAQSGLDKRVIFAGHISNADLLEHYRLADVTVLPSVTMGEAFGLVLLESMACATPVIASNLPGVRTVVEHGRDGLLIEPANSQALAEALAEMLTNEERRQAMGVYGRTQVEARYSWPHIGEQLEAKYIHILTNTPLYIRRLAREQR